MSDTTFVPMLGVCEEIYVSNMERYFRNGDERSYGRAMAEVVNLSNFHGVTGERIEELTVDARVRALGRF